MAIDTAGIAIAGIGVVAAEALLVQQVATLTGNAVPDGVVAVKAALQASPYWSEFCGLVRAGKVAPGAVSSIYALDTAVLAWARAEVEA